YVTQHKTQSDAPRIPRNIALPFRLYSKVNFRLLGGPYAGFLGSRYDPIWTEFSKKGTRPVPNQEGKPDLFDPYAGIRPGDKLELTGPDAAPDLSLERVGLRRSLLGTLEQSRRRLDAGGEGGRFD